MTIHVEHWHEYERHAVKGAGGGLVFKELAQREKPRILAVDLPCMDSTLNEEHGKFMGVRLFRR